MNSPYLTTEQLAARWQMSKGTLANRRVYGGGPKFIRQGRRKILYPLAEVERFEQDNGFVTTHQADAARPDRLHLLDAAGALSRILARDVSGLSWATIDSLQELRRRFCQLVELEWSPAPEAGAIARAERDCIEVTTQLLALIQDPSQEVVSLPQDVRDAAAALTAQLWAAGLLEANMAAVFGRINR